ncbi:MAG: hypothetical protein R2745_22680 [Vicinamibacterales bacterium]
MTTRPPLIRSVLVALALAVATGPAPRALEPLAEPTPAPAAVIANWERLIGTWVADNAPFKGPNDPNDAFGIEWQWGLGRKSLKGRLYGVRDGKEIGTYWEFHEYWHPGEGRVIATQHGSDGTFGSGPHEIRNDGTSEMVQTFWNPRARTTTRVGHRSRLDGDTHTTTSFDVSASGTWTERRTYVWKRRPGA